jgi:hypothetical protein
MALESGNLICFLTDFQREAKQTVELHYCSIGVVSLKEKQANQQNKKATAETDNRLVLDVL